MRALLVRGLVAGLAFAAALLVVETIAIALFVRAVFLEGATSLLNGELPSLALKYALFGAALGLVVGVPIASLQRRWRSPWNRSGALIGCLVLAFGVLAFVYPGESMVTRGTYFAEALGAWILTGAGRLLVSGLQRLVRRMPLSWSTPQVRRRFVIAAAALLAVAAFATTLLSRTQSLPEVARPALAQGSAPNVVLIVVDTLRRDHVSAYGYSRPTSPNIDQLAAEGALYEHAFTPAPWTLPAHASLFTGLYPSQHQTNHEHTRLGADKITIAETLRARGYLTGGYSANPWVSAFTGLDQGFDQFECLGRGTVSHAFFVNLLKPTEQDLGGAAVTAGLIDFMRRAKQRGKPFFAFANYLEAHEPFGSVPESVRTRFLNEPLPRDAGKTWLRDGPRFLCADCEEGSTRPGMVCEKQRWRVTDQRVREITDLYDAGILYVDQQIGKVRAALAELGLLDQTLIVVTSDHGEDIGEHGHMGHGVFLHDAMLSVPLVMRYPRSFPPNTRLAMPTLLLDVLPTIEQVVGIVAPTKTEGRSLVPSSLSQDLRVIHAEADPVDASAAKTMSEIYQCDMSLTLSRRLSSQRETLKYVWASSGTEELYDLKLDPREERNLADERAEQSRTLRSQLLAWYATVRSTAGVAQKGEMDAQTKQRLRSLGYVQ